MWDTLSALALSLWLLTFCVHILDILFEGLSNVCNVRSKCVIIFYFTFIVISLSELYIGKSFILSSVYWLWTKKLSSINLFFNIKEADARNINIYVYLLIFTFYQMCYELWHHLHHPWSMNGHPHSPQLYRPRIQTNKYRQHKYNRQWCCHLQLRGRWH